MSRLTAIDERMAETFRYVEPSPDNKHTFSYEFSSILRDAGSVFDSAMRELLEFAKYPRQGDEYNIRDYRKFLVESVNGQGIPPEGGGIETFVVTIASQFAGRYLIPFASLSDEGRKLEWWDAYNDVKHADLEKTAQGSLLNSLNALGAVSILNALVGFPGRFTRSLGPPMIYDPMDEIRRLVFGAEPGG